ncbi:ATP-grasp domain-containing protein [Paracoccus denitrificans]|uniref:ATP-grasp domain-containing protein n=1 Tax=Paracoccus denitrificans TaxID=266 RepID=UPI003364D80C
MSDMSRRPGNVLISSASRKVPMIQAAQAALRRLNPEGRVIAGDMDAEALAGFVADGFWRMPVAREDNLVELLEGCLVRGITTVFPTRDGELPFWAHARARFAEAGIDVVVSDVPSVTTCIDKLAFSRFGESMGLGIIPSALVLEEIDAAAYVVKERFGAGSRNLGIGLSSEAARSHAHGLEAPLFQPFIAGREISMDAWMDDKGVPAGVILRWRDKVVAGESVITTTFRDAALEETALRILAALRLRGPVVMQGIVDAAGKLHVIECNARFGGASTVSLSAGLQMLLWSIAEGQGLDWQDIEPFRRVQEKVRQVRVPSDVIIHDPDL